MISEPVQAVHFCEQPLSDAAVQQQIQMEIWPSCKSVVQTNIWKDTYLRGEGILAAPLQARNLANRLGLWAGLLGWKNATVPGAKTSILIGTKECTCAASQ